MVSPKCTTDEFVAIWRACGGSPKLVAETIGVAEPVVYARRARLAKRGIRLETSGLNGARSTTQWSADDGWTFPRVRNVNIDTGHIIVFSDAHYWPGEASTAHKGLLEVCKALKPRRIVANGDIFDGARISRHDAHGWGKRPSVKEELDVCAEKLGEIEDACGGGRCEKDFNVGNHDVRFERSLISKVSDFEGLSGFRLVDHFPRWEMAWSMNVNDSVMIKHRNVGGIHAGYNNTLKGGRTIVTGHTHILEVKPWVDYNGRRWGVQTGTLSDPYGAHAEYAENNPSPACSGFAVLTFRDGMLLPPEIAEVIRGQCYFRGEVVA